MDTCPHKHVLCGRAGGPGCQAGPGAFTQVLETSTYTVEPHVVIAICKINSSNFWPTPMIMARRPAAGPCVCSGSKWRVHCRCETSNLRESSSENMFDTQSVIVKAGFCRRGSWSWLYGCNHAFVALVGCGWEPVQASRFGNNKKHIRALTLCASVSWLRCGVDRPRTCRHIVQLNMDAVTHVWAMPELYLFKQLHIFLL